MSQNQLASIRRRIVGLFSGKSMATGGAAAALAAILMGTALVPAAHAVDAEDLVVQGPAFVGSGLYVKGAYEYFSACDPNPQPSYSVQWLRDGQPVYPEPDFSQFYDLDIEDVGSRISAVVTGVKQLRTRGGCGPGIRRRPEPAHARRRLHR